MPMTALEKYYGKFDEESRLLKRHGQVEFITSMKYINDTLNTLGKAKDEIKILDIGAGTGRYSVALSNEGYDVTAVELVKSNLEKLRAKHTQVKTWQGNAMDLHFLPDEKFDIVLLFGPLYHLHRGEERLKALSEASRVMKKEGKLFVAYIMNEYSVLTYCFKERHIKECIEKGTLTSDFHGIFSSDDLYSYVRLEDIASLNEKSNLEREKIIAADGAADYMRRELAALSEEEFSYFVQYHLSICERSELLGSSAHIVDIVHKK